ncbi:MAG: phospho-N-acetylmuramoyl-pentapeptide-transferase [Clostridia bacterium]|nr:phospho-N-acetylmuramoyl-pentapeptide-transferase [Clostridia bacterium]
MDNYIPIFAALISFAVTAIIGIPFIPFLKKLKYGQTILDEGPKWHKEKEGTPTMGGIMIVCGVIIGLLAAVVLSLSFNGSLSKELSYGIKPIVLIAGIIFALMCSAIGLMDDYIKVVKKRNLGLTAKQKTILQLLATVAYLATLAIGGVNTTWLPYVGDINITHGFGLLFWPISLIFIYYIVNAVNLTDGVDGLASCITLVVACAFMLICTRVSNAGMACLSAALGGACVGFILWNAKPAKVFMGDTGSMFLGGMVVAIAFGCGKPVLLIPIGIVYICEALSVVLQVFWFKTTGKRIFKMSPIHHHFEMSGWSEDKICLVFSLVTLIFSIISIMCVYFAW